MIGDDDPVGSEAHGIAGVFGIEDALDQQFALPEVVDPFAFPPADRRIEIRRHPADVIGETLPAAQIGRLGGIPYAPKYQPRCGVEFFRCSAIK
jgi:hypothetical protein